MFNKDEKTPKDTETIIGQSVKVKGDFVGQGNFIIEGEFEGTLTTSGNILVGEHAKVTAEISGREATILGDVNGNINLSGSIELGQKAEIKGNITASGIAVAHGAVLNGKISIGSSTKNIPEDVLSN